MLKFLKGPAIYAVAIPLALILGYLVSSPDFISLAVLGLILFFFALPLLLKWHHSMLILFWNTAFIVFFLPGQPDVWLVCVALSMGISLLNHFMFQTKFLSVPEMTRPLIFFSAVVVFTAMYRGGINVRVFGGEAMGGRYYFYVLGAVAGYFAFSARQVPAAKSEKMASFYFLSATTAVLANFIFVLGPSFYFLYNFVQAGGATGQAAAEYGSDTIDRIQGLAMPCSGVMCFLLLHYGVRGLFDWTKPWRFGFLCLTIVVSCFAGFRSVLVLLFLVFAFQFYFEGLFRTHIFPVVVALAICGLIPVAFFSERLPYSVQRAISFLPVNVDSEVQANAKGSVEWRTQMWQVVWKDVPKYFLIGKGYAVDPTDMFLTSEAMRMGILSDYEVSILAGDYHSGPLSVLVPFGIFGTAAFLWVLGAGGWVLFSNFRYGDARLRRINSLLLSYYLANCFSFFFIFGALNSTLPALMGVIGLGVTLNGGVKRAVAPKAKRVTLTIVEAMEPS